MLGNIFPPRIRDKQCCRTSAGTCQGYSQHKPHCLQWCSLNRIPLFSSISLGRSQYMSAHWCLYKSSGRYPHHNIRGSIRQHPLCDDSLHGPIGCAKICLDSLALCPIGSRDNHRASLHRQHMRCSSARLTLDHLRRLQRGKPFHLQYLQ